MDERQVALDKLDDRLRSVETTLSGLQVEVQESRCDIKEGFDRLNAEGRKRSCPHNDDFVNILNALDSGGKRFSQLEEALEEAIATRNSRITDEAGERKKLEERVETLENKWTQAVTSVKSAKWVFGIVGAVVAFVWTQLYPLIKAAIERW